MNTPIDPTTPMVDTLKTTPTMAPDKTGPSTFEDCIAIIETSKDDSDIANLKAALNKLHGFFKTRIGKRKSDTDRDGGAAVKSALAASRPFKPYEARKI